MTENKTTKLLKLVKENPTLPIIFEVDNEVVPDDEYGWYLGSMCDCCVGKYALLNERVLDDIDEFKERYFDYHYEELNEMFPKDNGNSDTALEEYLNKIADENFKTAIVVSIIAYSE